MLEVTTKDLKDRLSEWIRRVEESGEAVVVTRSGRPVCALVPLSDLPARDSDAVLADLAAAGAIRPARPVRRPGAFCGPTVPSRGSSAAEMVLEDRR